MTSRSERFAKFTEILQTLHRVRFSYILDGGEDKDGLCLPEFTILLCAAMLKEKGNDKILVSDLVKALPSSPQAISKYLRQLDEKGLVRRLSVSTDRRSTEIDLTENGEKTLKTARERMNSFFTEVFSGVSDEQLDSMLGFLSGVCDTMVEKSGAGRV